MTKPRRNIFALLLLLVSVFTISNADEVLASQPQQLLRRSVQEEDVETATATNSTDSKVVASFGNRTQQEIVGGSNANSGEFPWFVKFVGTTVCGGALISPNRVLTAAHCVTGSATPPSAVTVAATTGTDGETLYVCDIVVHPDYTRTPVSIYYCMFYCLYRWYCTPGSVLLEFLLHSLTPSFMQF